MKLVELGTIIDITKGKKPLTQSTEQKEGFLPYIDIKAFETGVITSYTDGNKCTPCEEGDLLIVCDGSRSGLVGVAVKGYVGSTLAKVSAKGIDNKYLYRYLQGKYTLLNTNKKGTGTPHLKIDLLRKQKILVPSLNEQKAILSRVETMMSKLEDGIETLKKTQQQLAVYRQAVLKEAFSGELTKSFRINHKRAENCLKDSARRSRDETLTKKHLKKLKYEWKDDVLLPKIPDEWEYIQIGDVAWSIKDGPHYSPKYSSEGIPFITGGNVRPNGVDFKSAKRISVELHNELSKRCHPEKGDMLYTKGGTTGIARVNTYDREFSVWVHVAVIKFVDLIDASYFQYVLNSPFCYQQSQKYTHGVGNQDLGLTRMINIIFPVCSAEEQKQIVYELESRLSVCDSIEKTVDSALHEAESLRQSVLKQAFEGEQS